jgi:membrane-associated phospholipid phosphatase
VVAWQLAKVVKERVRRGRPTDELEHIARRLGTPKDGRGFPSGHSAVAATMVTVLWPWATPRERVALVAAAAIVAFARIQVGAHLPIDTVGGAALGVLTGELWRLAVGDGAVPDGGGRAPEEGAT